MSLYAATLTTSVQQALTAKAKAFVGSDVALTVLEEKPLPPELPATLVLRPATGGSATAPVELLGITDPDRFAAVAFWDRSFADQPLRDLLQNVATEARAPGNAVPALVAGSERVTSQLGDTFTVSVAAAHGEVDLPVRVVARAKIFPGLRLDRPLLVFDARSLRSIGIRSEIQLWGRGSEASVLAAATAAGVRPIGRPIDAGSVLNEIDFLATSWTFGFLQSLAVLVGCLVLGGLLLYAETRQRARRMSYALSRRMGLLRVDHLAALLLEFSTPLLSGTVIGVAIAVSAAGLVHGEVDTQPSIPPGVPLRIPGEVVGALLGAWIVVALLAAAVAHEAAERATPGELLRGGE